MEDNQKKNIVTVVCLGIMVIFTIIMFIAIVKIYSIGSNKGNSKKTEGEISTEVGTEKTTENEKNVFEVTNEREETTEEVKDTTEESTIKSNVEIERLIERWENKKYLEVLEDIEEEDSALICKLLNDDKDDKADLLRQIFVVKSFEMLIDEYGADSDNSLITLNNAEYYQNDRKQLKDIYDNIDIDNQDEDFNIDMPMLVLNWSDGNEKHTTFFALENEKDNMVEYKEIKIKKEVQNKLEDKYSFGKNTTDILGNTKTTDINKIINEIEGELE